MWAKIIAFFKKIPVTYYNWKKRNEELSEFLKNSKANCSKIDHIDSSINQLNNNIQVVQGQVVELGEQVSHINGRLEIIGRGTKMELFDTLHTWRTELVKRGWASKAEKEEVKNIYDIYHNELKGNGQGEVYFEEIMKLPESEEEMNRRLGR